MVLVVVLIRSGSRVLKTWFGCQVAEQGTLLDLFNDFSAGKIDNTFPLSDTFSTASIECEIGRDKRVLTEFVRISLDVSVGEAVSTLGNYIEYNVRAQEDLSPSLPVSVFNITPTTRQSLCVSTAVVKISILPRISVTVILCVISA